VIAEEPKHWDDVLAGVEAGMVRVLKWHGPVMERGALEECCMRGGMNRFSFNAAITCSPVIVQYGRSVYGLIGAKVDRKMVEKLSAHKATGKTGRVLREFGYTDDGQVYLTYRLSKGAISGGVITVPAPVRDEVQGQFLIRTFDGRLGGTLVSKDGCAWGLGPALRSQDARPGDHLLVVFDREEREATVQIGDEGVLEIVAAERQPVL
jgi:hypothetical protein